jgi:hypothetical protein
MYGNEGRNFLNGCELIVPESDETQRVLGVL